MSELNTNNQGGKLLSIETIFKWKPVVYEENFNESYCEYEPQSDNEFNFFNFIINLIKSYVQLQDDKDSALNLLNDLELSAAKFTNDEDFKRIEDAYYHIVYASKICLLSETESHEVSVLLNKIKPVDEMNNFNKSAIHAMKSAAFALFSNEDAQRAYASIEKALKLDADNARWHFLKGLYKRKERKMSNPFVSPSLIEKECFEMALEKKPNNVVYKLCVADVYREISGHATKREENCINFLPMDSSFNKNLRENIVSKIRAAEDYYKKAAEEYADCPYVIFRCAEGLLKLRCDSSNVKLARELAKRGLKKSPDNVTGNLVMAFLFENIDKNIKEAQKYLKKCQEKQIFQAEMNMIRILHSTKRDKFSGIDALQILLEKYKEKPLQAILYSQMVSYYVFSNYDLVKACDYAMKFFSLSGTDSSMKVHRSCFQATAEPFSLTDVLIDEVKRVINDRQAPEEIQQKCEKFIQYMNFQNIPITKGFPQNLRQQILDGKTLNPNLKSQSNRKHGQHNENMNKRKTNVGRGNSASDRKTPANNYHPQTSKTINGNQYKQSEQKTQTTAEHLPSLMDKPFCNPFLKIEESKPEEENKQEEEKSAVVVEKQKKELSEQSSNSSSDDSDDKKLLQKLLKEYKRQKQAKQEKKSKSKTKSRKTRSSDESEEDFITELLKGIGISDKKSTRKKKHYSDSEDSASDHDRPKDRRRDRSRRRKCYTSDTDSDNSSRHSRRHHRHHYHRGHKRHSSTDSDYTSRSRHRKSHKKDRYARYSSSRDKYSRRNRSSDEDFEYNKKISHHRDDSISAGKRRRDRGDESVSPDRRRRDREDSVSSRNTRNRSPSYDIGSKRRPSDRKRSKDRSAGKSYYHDRSRDKDEDHRGSKTTKSKKERDSDSLVKNTREQNSPF